MKLIPGLKQKAFRTIAGGACVCGLLFATNALAVAAFPTSGSCAMLVTQPVPVGATVPFNGGYNVLAVLNFSSSTAGTIDYHSITVTYTANGYAVAAPQSSDSGSAIPFTIGTVSGYPSVRTITFTNSQGTIAMNAIAVNGGNTILIQGESQPFSGVCQF